MNLKLSLTILILSIFYTGFGQNFKPEKLIGKWKSTSQLGIQTYKFIDASHLLIYNVDNPVPAPRRYQLENITTSTFILILSQEGDTDKTHIAKEKCIWVNDNQFKTEPAQVIIGVGMEVFTRIK